MSTRIDTTVMGAARARWELEQRAFIEQWSETHDLDCCPVHGFWKLGPKKGGLQILTCPGCPSQEFVDELLRGDADYTCSVERDGTVRGDASILDGIAPLLAGAGY